MPNDIMFYICRYDGHFGQSKAFLALPFQIIGILLRVYIGVQSYFVSYGNLKYSTGYLTPESNIDPLL